MAFFNVNSSQANQQFKGICDALNKLATDNVTNGQGDNPLDVGLAGQGDRHAQNGVIRTPWVMSTTEWLTQSTPKAMIWYANPSDVNWSMPQRSVHTKNLFGTVLHTWPDTERNTFYDEFRLTFNLQSGNIIPVLVQQIQQQTFNIPPNVSQDDRISRSASAPVITGRYEPSGGIINFFDFMQLVDAPKLTARSGNQPPRANLVSIQYNSNLFPKLTLLGMFDSNGIRFTDSSATPNQVTSWSADFIVYDTVPRLTDNTSGQQTNSAMLALWAQERIDKAKLPGKTR